MKTILFLLLAVSLNLSADTLPPDVAALKAKRDAKIAEINQIYAEALGKLQKKALAEGNLTAANLIEKEIATATPDPFVNPIVGKWKRDTDGMIFEFKDESTGIFEGSTPFKVVQDSDSKVMIIQSSKWVDTVMLTSDPDTLAGKNSLGSAYKLTRVK